MRHFFTILGHEIRMLLVSPYTYIAATLFFGVMGFLFIFLLNEYSRAPQEMSPASSFFQYFALPVLFMVPLLTMKSISEERRNGTLETLLTTPVSTAEVILGKFSAAYLLYVLLWASTAAFFYILQRFAPDARALDAGPLLGGYIFIGVSGLLFIAVGIFASSLSRNQAVASLLSFTILFGLIVGLNFLGSLTALEAFNQEALRPVRVVVENVQILQHREDFCRGVVDTRQLLFYVSGTVLALIFSILSVEAKLLHS